MGVRKINIFSRYLLSVSNQYSLVVSSVNRLLAAVAEFLQFLILKNAKYNNKH